MNKVVKIRISGSSQSVIDNHRTAIINQIETIETAEAINSVVYENDESKYAFSSTITFSNNTAGTDFNTWIQNYITTNSADFESGNVNIHDCNHDIGGACINLIDWSL